MNNAPLFNSVNALKGEVAERPSAFQAAMSEADNFCRELDGLREKECRIQELEAENAELRTDLAKARAERDTAKAEAAGRRGW